MITLSDLAQIQGLLQPLRTRIANTVARAVVQYVDNSTKMQILQLGVLEGETVDDCEHFQGYGFMSVPLPGSEAVVLFPNGDRSHPLVVGVDDRRHRPTDWDEGDTGLYNSAGSVVRLKANGDIEVNPVSGGKVYIRSDGGTAEELVKKSEYDSHIHPGPLGPTGVPTVPAVGTTKLQAE